MNNIDHYNRWGASVNECLYALRELILRYDSEISETTKYGMACFLFHDKPKFYLGIDLKKNNEPYVLFVDGNLIDDKRLEQGTRKRMKIFRVDPKKDIDKDSLYELMQKAIDLSKK